MSLLYCPYSTQSKIEDAAKTHSTTSIMIPNPKRGKFPLSTAFFHKKRYF